MKAPAKPDEMAEKGGFLAPKAGATPVDHCFRCGVETPPGVGLCEQHNAGRISGPSATQMHATVFGGIVLGVVAFLIVAALAVTTNGPFEAAVTSAADLADGGVSLAFSVTNQGDEQGVADCRVTRDGLPRPDDLAFRTGALAAGETVAYQRQLEPPPGRPAYDLESLTVVCT